MVDENGNGGLYDVGSDFWEKVARIYENGKGGPDELVWLTDPTIVKDLATGLILFDQRLDDRVGHRSREEIAAVRRMIETVLDGRTDGSIDLSGVDMKVRHAASEAVIDGVKIGDIPFISAGTRVFIANLLRYVLSDGCDVVTECDAPTVSADVVTEE